MNGAFNVLMGGVLLFGGFIPLFFHDVSVARFFIGFLRSS